MTSLPMVNGENECQCETCQGACNRKPGWFLPGQIARAASYLGISEQEFFNTYISVDYYLTQESPIFVLAPATNNTRPGEEYSFDPFGQCIFFKEGKCQIHAVKPRECAFYSHEKSSEVCVEDRNKIIEAWRQNQDEIIRLLGREPQVGAVNPFDIFSMLIKSFGF